MKGRVACEMGQNQNELVITELVLRNILTEMEPAEIAALLSALVFQAKTDVEPKLTERLKKVCCLKNLLNSIFCLLFYNLPGTKPTNRSR